MYSTTIKLNHNEIPALINVETGEIKEVKRRKNNLPKGKSKLDYEEYVVVNSKMQKILFDKLSKTEMYITSRLINMIEFGTNSLKPYNNKTNIKILSNDFNIGINQVNKIFNSLIKKGVILPLEMFRDNFKEYWFLNPNIAWKGKLKDDELSKLFNETIISKLLKVNQLPPSCPAVNTNIQSLETLAITDF